MAINIPILSSFEDTGIRAAKAAFGNFKTAVGDAETKMGKFKAGSTVALDAVKANAGAFAMAAGSAIAGFAVKAIGEFQKLALEAGKFSEATGLAVEDASRIIEVAGDLGIPVDTLEGAIGRLNKTIGADPDKVRDLGVDLVYLKDGSIDANAVFLNTIERIKGIKDPAEKATVAAQLLGKGWQGMAELINMGATDLDKSLKSVSESKVIDQEELDKAREFRDTMDNLKGYVEDLSLAIGEQLVPALSDVAGLIEPLKGLSSLYDKIPGASWLRDKLGLFPNVKITSTAVQGLWGLFSKDKNPVPLFIEDLKAARTANDNFSRAAIDKIPQITNTFDKLREAGKKTEEVYSADTWARFYENQKRIIEVIDVDRIDRYVDKFKGLSGIMSVDMWEKWVDNWNRDIIRVLPDRIDAIKTKVDDLYLSVEDAKGAWDRLVTGLETQVDMNNIYEGIGKLKELAVDAYNGSEEAAYEYREEHLKLAQAFAEFVEFFPPNLSTRISILFEAGDIASLEYAAGLMAVISSPMGKGGIDPSIRRRIENAPARALGGPVANGSSYLVGERGPELFTPTMGGNITPNGALGGGMNITVNAGLGADGKNIGELIVKEINKFARSGGTKLDSRVL